MKNIIFDGLSVVILLSLFLVAQSAMAGKSPIDAFPEAEEGEVRYTIVLDEKDRVQELNYKVELIPGKVVETDGVNKFRIGLGLEAVSLQGWGYTYYRVTGRGELLTTMMAVSEEREPVTRFVAGESVTVRYNSLLPIVIYSPDDVEVHYRIWVAGDERKADTDL